MHLEHLIAAQKAIQALSAAELDEWYFHGSLTLCSDGVAYGTLVTVDDWWEYEPFSSPKEIA